MAFNAKWGMAMAAAVVVVFTALQLIFPAVSAAQNSPRDPNVIYAKICAYCHGHNVGPLIRGRHLPADMVTQFVRQGSNAMPAFRQTEISDVELAALSRWIERSAPDPKEHGR